MFIWTGAFQISASPQSPSWYRNLHQWLTRCCIIGRINLELCTKTNLHQSLIFLFNLFEIAKNFKKVRYVWTPLRQENLLKSDIRPIDQIVPLIDWSLLFFILSWPHYVSCLSPLRQSAPWTVSDEAVRSLWALWRRMTTTRWTTSTQTKILSVPR